MAPTYTMSAHLCKQICTSWRDAHQTHNGDHHDHGQDHILHMTKIHTIQIPTTKLTPSIRASAWGYAHTQKTGNRRDEGKAPRDDR